MSTQTTTTNYCFRCQWQPGPDDETLKRCTGCRSRHYCSKHCQSNDWPSHKKECRILAAGSEVPQRIRTTMRLNMNAFRPQPAERDRDTIYYIKLRKPHIHSTEVFGPCLPLNYVLIEMCSLLRREKSIVGEQELNEIVDGPGLLGIEHFNAPLPDGNPIRFEIVKEKNAEVARMLPGDVWNVFIMTPRHPQPEGVYVQVEDIEVGRPSLHISKQ